SRVPHLRDGFIVDNVGIRATREPLFSPSEQPKNIFRVFGPEIACQARKSPNPLRIINIRMAF
ncbi:hypothetical protein, partial [Edaphobacter sp.]|uniref:hypothetical protein n=1 Tax=Edaphobacter sp. TaxID=1934404 RepID=UPI002DB742E1